MDFYWEPQFDSITTPYAVDEYPSFEYEPYYPEAADGVWEPQFDFMTTPYA